MADFTNAFELDILEYLTKRTALPSFVPRAYSAR